MARYDTSLDDERGAVRADQHRTYRRGNRYDRGYEPREMTYFRPPAELRGHRGGSAGSYGFGNDYDRVYRGGSDQRRGQGAQRRPRRPDWEATRRSGEDYWADRYGVREEGGYAAWREGRGRQEFRARAPRGRGYDGGW